MWREWPFLKKESQLVYGVIDICCDSHEIGRCAQSDPKDTRPLFVREETETLEAERDGIGTANAAENNLNRSEFGVFGLAKELQRHVEIFRANPLYVWRGRAQLLYERCQHVLNLLRDFDRDE